MFNKKKSEPKDLKQQELHNNNELNTTCSTCGKPIIGKHKIVDIYCSEECYKESKYFKEIMWEYTSKIIKKIHMFTDDIIKTLMNRH